MYVPPPLSPLSYRGPRKLNLMNKFKAMTKLHRQSDRLIDSATSATLSKRDAKFVNEFLLLERTEQLSIIRFGIREIHPQYEEPEIAKASSQILFKIQIRPNDAPSFGTGTPLSQRKLSGRRFWG